MLTKKDKQDVSEIVSKAVMIGFQDFYDNIFEPHVNQSVKHHEELVSAIRGLKKDMTGIKEETTEIKEYIKDHDKRIVQLESIASVKN